MLTPIRRKPFNKDCALLTRRHYDMALLDDIVNKLFMEEPLPPQARPHWLSGNWAGYMECHVKGDWVIIYMPNPEEGTITFYRTGTHSDLF
ncbi:MAG: type II toxin-antitoxin system YafQ family toxin [Spirochaetaceae bacterium]|jgi:mRNA interferase YafQ|nr:type II toxin-antitoxin system YafQ family toxin [Spirochaetaceae bacterium]